MSNKVSVVIPVYNGEKFIARAIDSVLSQSVRPFEVIVINDGSTDGTLKIVNGYGEKVRCVSIPNGGVSNARNTGIKMVQGDYVAFLDADDVWHVNKLEKQLEVLQEHPQAGLCCCDYSVFDSFRGSLVNHFTVLKETDANFNGPLSVLPVKLLLRVNFVGTCSTVLVRKALLEKVGAFNVAYRQSEDFELWLRCGRESNFVLLSDVLVDKKAHSANLTNNLEESYLCHLKVLADIRNSFADYLKTNGLTADYQLDVSRTNYKLGELYFNDGQISKAFQRYWLGFSSYGSVGNFIHYLVTVSKKLLRLLSFGLISRKNLDERITGRAERVS